MRFGGLKDVIRALPGAAKGFEHGLEIQREYANAAANNEYKRALIEQAKQKALMDAQKQQAENYLSGLESTPTGGVQFRADASDGTSPYYKGRMAQAAFKAAEHPQRGTQEIDAELFNALNEGKPLPAGTKLPSNVVGPALNRKAPQEYADPAAVAALEKQTGLKFGKMTQKDYQTKAMQARGQDMGQERFDQGMGYRIGESLKDRRSKLAEKINSAALPRIGNNLRIIEKHTKIFSGEKPDISFFPNALETGLGTIPFVGGTVQSRAARMRGGEAGVEVTQATRDTVDAIIKADSGAQVTNHEQLRKDLSTAMSPFSSEEDKVVALKRIFESGQAVENLYRGGYGEDAWKSLTEGSDPGYAPLGGLIKGVPANPSQKRAAIANKSDLSMTGTDLPANRKKTDPKYPPKKQNGFIYYWNPDTKQYE